MAGALVFLVEAVSRQTVLGSLWWLASSPVPALLNLLLAGLLMALLAALAGNMRWGAVASVVLLLLAAAVHGGKQLVLGEPLYPWDLLLTRETAHVFGRGYFPFHWPMVAVCLVLAVLAVLLAGRLSRRRIPLWRRAVLAVSLCGVLAAMTFYRSWPLRRVMDSLVTNYFWDQGRNYRSNGFLLTFLINTQASMVLPPDDYSADRRPAWPSGSTAARPPRRPRHRPSRPGRSTSSSCSASRSGTPPPCRTCDSNPTRWPTSAASARHTPAWSSFRRSSAG